MWNLKCDRNEHIYETKTLTDTENRLVVAKQGVGEGKDREFGISRCKLVYIGWINNKVLLYSTGNYIQYPVINHNGKEYKKECVYIYILFHRSEEHTSELVTSLSRMPSSA